MFRDKHNSVQSELDDANKRPLEVRSILVWCSLPHLYAELTGHTTCVYGDHCNKFLEVTDHTVNLCRNLLSWFYKTFKRFYLVH